MKIVMVANYPPPYEGGIQFVLHNLAKQYALKNHDLTIIGADKGVAKGKNYTDSYLAIGIPAWNGLEKLGIPYPIYHPFLMLYYLISSIRQADVVHIHGYIYINTVLAAIIAKMFNKNIILTEHVGTINNYSKVVNFIQAVAVQLLGRITVNLSHHVTALNRRVIDELESLQFFQKPIHRIHNGVDSEMFHPVDAETRDQLRQKWQASAPIVLYAGRFVDKKGYNLVVEAVQETDNIQVWLCGKDPVEIEQENIRVIGLVSQQELAELYQIADIFVLPSIGEGFPLVLQEAMASKIPIIVNENLSNHEYISDDSALFVERNSQAIRSAIFQLLDNPILSESIATNAYQDIQSKYDWSVTAQTYLALYASKSVSPSGLLST